MSPPTKKQKTALNSSVAEDDGSLSETTSVAQPTSGEEPGELSEASFRKLPGELRNRIYELVFQDHHDRIQVRYRKRAWNMNHFELSDSKKSLRWKEPALLKAAKWIRAEVKLWYYGSKSISIVEKWLGHVTFHLSSGRWDKVHTWLPLAQLFCDHDFGFTIEELENEGDDRYHYYAGRSGQFGGTHRHIAHAMRQVIELGVRARDEKWRNDYLEIMFEEWAEKATYDSVSKGHQKFKNVITPMQQRMEWSAAVSDEQRTADETYHYQGLGTISSRGVSQIITRRQATLGKQEQEQEIEDRPKRKRRLAEPIVKDEDFE
ncbi:hypothetical protein LTR17_009527 [Elasticomyces elasticus]|nr:hypothetical protein LTR17_009527 [Elasticomyces elasticus]